MTDNLSVRQATYDPKSLTLLQKNARRMTAVEFRRLCDNIERDGALTSAPLVYPDPDTGRVIVISGNHRVMASLKVGLKEIPVLEITERLTEERLVAIQLAHNAISGSDDPNILRELYESLSTIEQAYSGLTEESFGALTDPELVKLSALKTSYEEMTFMFLPEAAQQYRERAAEVVKRLGADRLAILPSTEIATLIHALDLVKHKHNISNTSVALCAMAKLAIEALASNDDAQEDA